MYSVIVNGEVLDYKFKRMNPPFIYNFYIGDIFIGQVFRMKNNSWSAVSFKTVSPLGAVDGFKSRLDACELLLKINGYRHR